MKSQQTETCGSSARPEINVKQMLISTTSTLMFINETNEASEVPEEEQPSKEH